MASGNSREKLGRTGRSARHRMVVRTESLRIPNWHDTGSTSPRSVGEVTLIWDTISHYSPVLIAPLAINFIAPAHLICGCLWPVLGGGRPSCFRVAASSCHVSYASM